MKNGNEKLHIPKIEKGIVIDHIPVGMALKVASFLNLDAKVEEPCGITTIGINYDSKKMGNKDLIKVENRNLSQKELDSLSIMAPGASIKRIENYTVIEKINIKIPEVIENLICCNNPRCISNNERGLTTKFLTVTHEPLILKCHFCERTYNQDEIKLL